MLAGLAAALLLLAGCGSHATTTTPETSPASLKRPAGSTDYTFTFTDPNGIKIAGLLELNPLIRANSSQFEADWKSLDPTAPRHAMCATDPTTDGVITGYLRLRDTTPAYLPDDIEILQSLSPNVADDGADGRMVGIEVDAPNNADQSVVNACAGLEHFSPDFKTATWSAPIAITYPDLYSPHGIDEAELNGARILEPYSTSGCFAAGENTRLYKPKPSRTGLAPARRPCKLVGSITLEVPLAKLLPRH